jgi:DNA polymerase-4
MDLPINPAEPLCLHVDLNGAFASIEQQANRLLRGKAIGVAANPGRRGTIISPSYEAKAFGIKTGDRVFEAMERYPRIQILHADPDKYFFVHKQFARIFADYSPDVTALSIDEAVIDFAGTGAIRTQTLQEIGYEIKRRIRSEIGEWISCNVGIGTNRFLAKLAASLHKPDGLDTITSENLREVYASVGLLDLCGINRRYKARLNVAGIHTPLEFVDAPVWQLKNQVFESIVGYYWYLRLRGYEIDRQRSVRRSYGQQYHLHRFTADTRELSRLMMKLCEKMGRRLRRAGLCASGIAVSAVLTEGYWHESRKTPDALYATQELHQAAMALLAHRPFGLLVTQLGVSCYGLKPLSAQTMPLFGSLKQQRMRLAVAADQVNDRFGEYVVHPATMMGMGEEIVKRVPFHATTDTLTEIYATDPDLDDAG